MLEPRTPVMILVEASWEDQSGTPQAVSARMEDRSAGGACIRVRTRIRVGSKLRIQWRWDRFSGIAKYCRSEGKEYLVGIQRDTANSPTLNRSVPKEVPLRKAVPGSDPPVSTGRIQIPPKPQESPPSQISSAKPQVENVSIVLIASGAAAQPSPAAGHETLSQEKDDRDRPRISQPKEKDFDVLRRTELRTKDPPIREEASKERKPMTRKWLRMAPWHNKQDSLSAIANGGGGGNSSSNARSERENRAPRVASPTEETPADAAGEAVVNFQVELLPMEDIYRAAGIMSPRKGYSINKVVEMLNSQHIRGLSQETKRVAVLMALDAAGVLIDEVLQDAKARQNALDSYEAEQRKQAEAEWARKVERNVQIQAELERAKAYHIMRISRNLDEVAREKAMFGGWLSLKQQESQSMAEAAELCLKSPPPEPASAPPADVSAAKALAKSV